MESGNKKRSKSVGTPSRKYKTSKTKKDKTIDFFRFFRENVILVSLLVVIFGMLTLKYFEDMHYANSKFIDFGVNIYELLEVPRNAKSDEIKANYRKLSLKWHPDKNKGSIDCKDKFIKIKEAYKILSNPKLRQIYDRTNGFIVDIIPSNTKDITHSDYNSLVKSSSSVWVIQVFSDNCDICKSFGPLWESHASELGKFAEFGRINALLDPKAVRKLPMKVQIYPAVFMLFPDGGYDVFPPNAISSSQVFRNYFKKVYPQSLNFFSDYDEFKLYKSRLPKLLFYTAGDYSEPSLEMKFLSLKYKWQFEMSYITSKEHFSAYGGLLKDILGDSGDNSHISHYSKTFVNKPEADCALVLYSVEDMTIQAVHYQRREDFEDMLNSVASMSLLVNPPTELSRETFDNLCVPEGKRERFCVILVEKDTQPSLNYRGLLQKLVHYDIFESIGNVFNDHVTDCSDIREAESLSSVADVQLASLPAKLMTKEVTLFLGNLRDCILLLDVRKQKFCVMNLDQELPKSFDCEIHESQRDTWISDLMEGASDTITWHNILDTCKGSFLKEKCLKSQKRWLKMLL